MKKTISGKFRLDDNRPILVKLAKSEKPTKVIVAPCRKISSPMAKKKRIEEKVENSVLKFGATMVTEFQEEGDEEEPVLSLDSLREAFAAFDREQREFAPVLSSFGSVDVEETQDGSDESVDEIAEPATFDLNPRGILEAMLFIGNSENKPLSSQQAAGQMRNVSPEEIDDAAIELNQIYDRFGCPYRITTERNGYRMVLRPEFETIREKFYGKIREATLSQQAIDTLAIVAYRQPIRAEEVQKLRREACVGTLSQLVRRGLLTTDRESQGKKRDVVYRTTKRFLEVFNLASLDDLPLSDDLH